MSTAVSMEPLGLTQQLHWVATVLAVQTLWFGLTWCMCLISSICVIVHIWFPSDHKRWLWSWPSPALSFFLLILSTEAPDLKQEERLQELESCSGVGSTSDDTEVREVSSRPSTPCLSVVSGRKLYSFILPSPSVPFTNAVLCLPVLN